MNRNNWNEWQNHLREVKEKEERLQKEICRLREEIRKLKGES